MNGFTPGLLDRLMDERSDTPPATPLSAEQFKDSVARDLEALLNTRIAQVPAQLGAYPHARASILHYGLADLAAFCLTSSLDRAAVCASLKDAIETHEPRLRDVTASLEPDASGVNRLNFVIHARLTNDALSEPVNFNAVWQPSSLRYAIRRHSRPGRPWT